MNRSVLVLSSRRVLREALTRELRRHARDFDVLEACGSATEAARALQTDPRTIVLIDATEGDGRAKAIRARVPDAWMITFGVRHDGREIASWIENGVLDCLAEDAGLDDLVGAVERIVYDEPGPSPNPDAILSGSARSAEEEDGGTANNPRLTAREVDVALLLREGLSNKDIGRRLRISPATVKNHVHHILGKLRVGRRGEAVALLQRKGGLPSAARGD